MHSGKEFLNDPNMEFYLRCNSGHTRQVDLQSFGRPLYYEQQSEPRQEEPDYDLPTESIPPSPHPSRSDAPHEEDPKIFRPVMPVLFPFFHFTSCHSFPYIFLRFQVILHQHGQHPQHHLHHLHPWQALMRMMQVMLAMLPRRCCGCKNGPGWNRTPQCFYATLPVVGGHIGMCVYDNTLAYACWRKCVWTCLSRSFSLRLSPPTLSSLFSSLPLSTALSVSAPLIAPSLRLHFLFMSRHFLEFPHYVLFPPLFPFHFLSMSASFSTYVPLIASHVPTSPFMSVDFLVTVCHFPSFPLHSPCMPFHSLCISHSFPLHVSLSSPSSPFHFP